jgi:hypothetical protein
MKLEDLMSEIESDDFFAELAIASDVNLFLRFARKRQVVRSLLTEIWANEKAQRLLAIRVINLLKREYDAAYVRPCDTALAIYVWALSAVQSPYAEAIAAETAASPHLWWAKQVARRVQEARPTRVNVSQGTVNVSKIVRLLATFITNTDTASTNKTLLAPTDISREAISIATGDTKDEPPRVPTGEGKYHKASQASQAYEYHPVR